MTRRASFPDFPARSYVRQIVTGSFDKTAKLWDANTGQLEPKEESKREEQTLASAEVHSHSQGPPHRDCLCCLQCTGPCATVSSLRELVLAAGHACCDRQHGQHSKALGCLGLGRVSIGGQKRPELRWRPAIRSLLWMVTLPETCQA